LKINCDNEGIEKASKVVKDGGILIFPTDTVYGLGCDATNPDAVLKLRKIKNSFTKPMSIIAPSKDWILQNCDVPETHLSWLDKLPGPYTLIFKLNKRFAVAPQVNPADDSVGCRIPKHWFADFVTELGVPIITTSANIVTKPYMTALDDLAPSIKDDVDFIIYEGELDGAPSAVVNLSGEEEKVIRNGKIGYMFQQDHLLE